MPKKIKNVESRIIKSAETVFRDKGYVDADVKEIASHAGVAVGTLYNYWPSKKMLFAHVSREYWKDAFAKTDKIMKLGVNPHLKLMMLIKNMYEHFEKQIKIPAMDTSIESFSYLMSDNGVWEEIHCRMESLLDEIMEIKEESMDEKDFKRVSNMIPLLIVSSIADFPNDKESNIRFINNFVNYSIKLSVK